MRESILFSCVVLALLAQSVIPADASNYYQGTVLFSTSRHSNWEIYRVNEDGTGSIRLTNDTKSGPVDQHPVFTPGGSKIVWSRDFNIWIMNPDGNNKQQLTVTGMDNHPWVNSNGTKIYFNRMNGSQREIWRMNLDGTGQELIKGDAEANRWHPSVRSDELIVYVADNSTPPDNRGDAIRIYNLSTKEERTIYARGYHVSASTWSPDGTKIIFSKDPDGDGNHIIATINADGSNEQIITDGSYHEFTPYYKYPTGDKIVHVRKLSQQDYEIVLRDANGANPSYLSNDPYGDLIVVESGSCNPTPPPHPGVYSSQNRYAVNSLKPYATVNVSGMFYQSNISVHVYIVPHRIWNHNDTIPAPVAHSIVNTDANGEFSLVNLWTTDATGLYDIVVDIDDDGLYFSGKDAIDADVKGTGFEIALDNPPSVYPLYSTDDSGIINIKVSDVVNAIIMVEGYSSTPTTPSNSPQDYKINTPKTTVTYTRQKIDPYKPGSYRITATDIANQTTSACPLFLKLSREPRKPVSYYGTLTSTETIFEINNNGVTNIQVNLNGIIFQITAHPNKRGQEGNEYFIPEYGEFTIDLSPYMVAGNNSISLEARGKPDGFADILISE